MESGLLSVLRPDQLADSAATLRAYDSDAYTVDRSKPTVVCFPESTAEVQAVVRWCLAQGVPFTPRGAGTGLSGGAMAALGGVVISTKRLNRVLDVDLPNRRLLAQCGVTNVRLTQAVASEGLHFAPDPSSQSVSTLGGNIAENSGGPHTLKYGVTTQHILAVTLVDNEGEIRQVGSGVSGGPGPDLLSAIIGAEGTLGIVTEAWVRLTPNPAKVATCLAAFGSLRDATQCVSAIIAAGIIPAALELMDAVVLQAVQAAFGLDMPPGTAAMLLIECDGSPEETEREMAAVYDQLAEHRCLSHQTAKNESERLHLWKARKKGIGAMGRLAPTIVTHDGVIPRSKLPEMLVYVAEIARHEGLGVGNIFHAGDGNLHPCFFFDDREAGIIDRVVRAGEAILRRCIELGGSVSGEHGIGVEKIDLMAEMFTAEDLRLQQQIKSLYPLSPLSNPCKLLPNQKGCVEHQRRWRGAAT
jgi:glycolate oxidase